MLMLELPCLYASFCIDTNAISGNPRFHVFHASGKRRVLIVTHLRTAHRYKIYDRGNVLNPVDHHRRFCTSDLVDS